MRASGNWWCSHSARANQDSPSKVELIFRPKSQKADNVDRVVPDGVQEKADQDLIVTLRLLRSRLDGKPQKVVSEHPVKSAVDTAESADISNVLEPLHDIQQQLIWAAIKACLENLHAGLGAGRTL